MSSNDDADPGRLESNNGDSPEPFSDSKEEQSDPNLVDWDGPDDPENPQNFPRWRKWTITASMTLMAFSATFSSSVFGSATAATAKDFDVSEEVTILGTALFVLVSIRPRICPFLLSSD